MGIAPLYPSYGAAFAGYDAVVKIRGPRGPKTGRKCAFSAGFHRPRPCIFAPDPVSLHLFRYPTDSLSCPMRLSRFFLPILKENPKEAEIVSHRLMLRAGMMRQGAAGIYPWLALGFGGVEKIRQIRRQEQDSAGALEPCMPAL